MRTIMVILPSLAFRQIKEKFGLSQGLYLFRVIALTPSSCPMEECWSPIAINAAIKGLMPGSGISLAKVIRLAELIMEI